MSIVSNKPARRKKREPQPMRDDEVLQKWQGLDQLSYRELKQWLWLKTGERLNSPRSGLMFLAEKVLADIGRAIMHKGPRIDVDELATAAFCNSKECPEYVNDHGVRKQWVGIGWIEVGTPLPSDPLVIHRWMK